MIDSSVILLIRDPRDAVVSNYFQKRFRYATQFADGYGNVIDCVDVLLFVLIL